MIRDHTTKFPTQSDQVVDILLWYLSHRTCCLYIKRVKSPTLQVLVPPSFHLMKDSGEENRTSVDGSTVYWRRNTRTLNALCGP